MRFVSVNGVFGGDGGDLFAGAEVEAEVEAGVEGGVCACVFGFVGSGLWFGRRRMRHRVVGRHRGSRRRRGCRCFGARSRWRVCLRSPVPSIARASSMRRRKLLSAARARAGRSLSSDGAGDGVPGAHAGGERHALEGLHGGLADAARGRVDDARERDGVVQVLHQLEVAEDVFDFGAVVEGEAADHVVLDLIAAQRLFHQARLRVGAIEHGAARADLPGRRLRGDICWMRSATKRASFSPSGAS